MKRVQVNSDSSGAPTKISGSPQVPTSTPLTAPTVPRFTPAYNTRAATSTTSIFSAQALPPPPHFPPSNQRPVVGSETQGNNSKLTALPSSSQPLAPSRPSGVPTFHNQGLGLGRPTLSAPAAPPSLTGKKIERIGVGSANTSQGRLSGTPQRQR